MRQGPIFTKQSTHLTLEQYLATNQKHQDCKRRLTYAVSLVTEPLSNWIAVNDILQLPFNIANGQHALLYDVCTFGKDLVIDLVLQSWEGICDGCVNSPEPNRESQHRVERRNALDGHLYFLASPRIVAMQDHGSHCN